MFCVRLLQSRIHLFIGRRDSPYTMILVTFGDFKDFSDSLFQQTIQTYLHLKSELKLKHTRQIGLCRWSAKSCAGYIRVDRTESGLVKDVESVRPKRKS